MDLRQRLPLLRWSVLRTGIGIRNFTRTGQIGDGREAAAADYVEAKARRGDVDDVLATIDEYAYSKSFLVNVGDEKGRLLDAAVVRANPRPGAGAGHLLRLRRAADRPCRARGPGVLGRAVGRQCRSGPAHLGPRRRRRPSHLRGGNDRRRRSNPGHAARRSRIRSWHSGFPVHRPRQERLPSRPAEHHRPRLATPGVHRRRRQRQVPGVAEVPGLYARAAGPAAGSTVEHRTHMEYQKLVPDLVLESELLG